MPKSLSITLIFALLVLGACQSSEASTTPEAATEESSSLEALSGEAAAAEMVCTSVSAADRQDFLADSPIPPVTADDWTRGPADAAISIIEYSDFQCPYCAQLEPDLEQLMADYPDDVQLVYRHFPLIGTAEEPIHPKAALSTQAAEAAGRQDAFWEMHDLLFARQAEWTELEDDAWEAYLLDAAGELGLDVDQFETDLHDPELEALANDAWEYGVSNGLPGTPTVLMNGIPYSTQLQLDYSTMETILKLETLAKRQYTSCPEMVIDPEADYTAILHTEKGDIVLHLLPKVAPMAVNSFVFLAENGWFDNVSFHRVVAGFVAQAGDPTGTGLGGPGYTFNIEPSSDWIFDRAGLLAMANSGPTSNGSQFFITLAPALHLNGAYTIFGEVIGGMDVVESLTVRDPSLGGDLPDGDLILDVIIEKN